MAFSIGASAFADCVDTHVHLVDGDTNAQFVVEIAATPEAQTQGLMFRDYLPRSTGMLFVYEREKPVSFWMKNTRIALDILYFDQKGHLVHVERNAQPHDLTMRPSPVPIQYALEINGGLFDLLRLSDSARLLYQNSDFGIKFEGCAP